MKVLLPFMMMGCGVVGYFVGYSVGPEASVLAQAQTGAPSLERPGWAPLAPDQPAKEQYWSVDDLRKMHAERAAAAAAGKPMPYLALLLGRTHTIGLITRLPHDKPIPSNITGRISQWDDAEQHQGVSDIYVVAGGSGTMAMCSSSWPSPRGRSSRARFSRNPGSVGKGVRFSLIRRTKLNPTQAGCRTF